jgi:diguanylate cyclase (GGDEF)-like protein
MVLVVGVAASVLAALQWRSYIGDQQAREVTTTTATASASLSAAIQRDEDLVETLRGVVASGATVTNPQLQELYTNVGATNDAGIIGLAYVEAVPYGDVSNFEDQLAADPPLGITVTTTGPSLVRSEGVRPQYCLIRLVAASSAGAKDLSAEGTKELSAELSGGYDFCAGQFASAFDDAAAIGRQTVTSLSQALASTPGKRDAPGVQNSLFDIVVPVYRPGAPVKTTAERADALLGWADGLFSPLPVLTPVLARTAGLSIMMSYVNAAGTLRVAVAGPELAHAFHRTVRLAADGHWVVRISVVPTNASATVQGLGVLADLFVILLLVAFILSLFRSRRNALESVENKNQELLHRALHDTLTGLPNRDLVLDRAAVMLERGERDEQKVAAFLIDLDGFNAVNDTYGHRTGDEVLDAVARRLMASLGPSDMLGRMGGDEFVVLAEGPSIAGGVEALAARLLAELSPPFEITGLSVVVRVSAHIGIAVGPGPNAEDLLRDADTALNEAKSGKGRFTLFEPAMHTAARGRLSLQVELRAALEQHQFFLVYQPVFRLSDVVPTGVEALLRWRHPLRGVVPPLDFIPLLEETGMIVDVGREVLQLACEQAMEWERRGLPIFVAVNVSALQLESEQFAADVADVLARTGLDPARLEIEITESALMRDAHDTARRLGNLKALGIRLAIDDFGTGYSSLAYLRQFPVDVLKIDRSFVTAMTASTGGMALVRTMLELARALNLETVAEGIEEESQLAALRTELCRSGQGFLMAKPLDPGQIELFFDNATPRKIAAAVNSA